MMLSAPRVVKPGLAGSAKVAETLTVRFITARGSDHRNSCTSLLKQPGVPFWEPFLSDPRGNCLEVRVCVRTGTRQPLCL